MKRSLHPSHSLFQGHRVGWRRAREGGRLEREVIVKAASTALVGLVCFCGCAHEYLLKLHDGDEILAMTKPKLQGTNYFFTDRTGSPCVIAESHVAKIRAVTVVEEKPKQVTPPPPKKPKHWYFLWLA
jgi:hypothetical protein